jgi:hypothetical protein
MARKGECARARPIASLTFMKSIVSFLQQLRARPFGGRNICNWKRSTYVSRIVKEWNSQMKPMASTSTRRFVKVAPPTVHAGVGDALRQAFRMDGEMRSLKTFEDLLEQLH